MKRRVIAFLCAAVLVVLAGAAAAETQLETLELQILATSDVHGQFSAWDYSLNQSNTAGSLTQIASAIRELRTENTLLVDAGDTIQGNSNDIFLEDELHPMAAAMNAMNYDVWVTGNHEYNYGVDTLKKVMNTQQAKVLVGNVYEPDGTPLADGYTIIEKSGVKIGVIGMVSPLIARWDAANLAGYTVTDPVEETRKIMDSIMDETDVLIAVVHMGVEIEHDVPHTGASEIAMECPELDLIVAAHTHTVVEGEEVNGVLIVENKDAGQSLSQVKLTLERNQDGWTVTRRSSVSHDISAYPEDEKLTALLSDYDQRAKEDAVSVVGKLVGGDLVSENEIADIPTALIQDTPMMDFMNQVCLYYSGADVSSVALLSRDAGLREGDIPKCSLSHMYKFSNTLYTLQMTGAQLKTYMEWNAKFYNQYQPGYLTVSFNPDVNTYNYDMFAGVNYEVNIANPVGSRIENLTWPDGTPVKPEDVFTIAVNNYRANSHLLVPGVVFAEDDLPVLLEADIRPDIGYIRDMLCDYIVHVKNGIITPEVDNNWKITGNDWDEALHDQAVQLLADGILTIPQAKDGWLQNLCSITEEDVRQAAGK